jgi:hypothetical protein
MKLKKEISSSKVEDRIIIISYKIEGLIHRLERIPKRAILYDKRRNDKKEAYNYFRPYFKGFCFL